MLLAVFVDSNRSQLIEEAGLGSKRGPAKRVQTGHNPATRMLEMTPVS